MRTVFEARASTILYRLAVARPDETGVYLLPANVCPVVPLALLAAERRFEFLDLDPRTLCIDETRLRERLVDRDRPPTAGLVYVRSYGVETDAGALFQTLRALAPELLLIDDRCPCRPEPDRSKLDHQGAGVVLFSTGYSKQVDLGLGGFAHLTDDVPYRERSRRFDPDDLERVTSLYQTAIRERQPLYHDRPDDPSRRRLARLDWLDTERPEISWAAYRERLLARRQQAESHRTRINDVYRRLIPAAVQLAPGYHGWRFQIRVPERDVLLERIFAAGLFASAHYFPAGFLFGGEEHPVASGLHTEIMNLFNDHRVSEQDAERIGSIVADHLAAIPCHASGARA